jgi:S-adenosylmethionine synthetase
MAFLMLPIITVLFFLGVGVQAWQLAQAVPGAGVPGRMEAAANVSAQQALVFGAACVATASATPGLISASIHQHCQLASRRRLARYAWLLLALAADATSTAICRWHPVRRDS